MASSPHPPDAGIRPSREAKLCKDSECLLNVAGRHFLVKILEVTVETVRVSFPARDYPVEGMRAYLEFHDDDGFYYYASQVLKGPTAKGDGLVLYRLSGLKRSMHRGSFRVPTDLTVQVRDQVHARKYNAALLNISAGGALIQTEAPFDFSTTIELTLSLPGEPTHMILSQVVHTSAGTAKGAPCAHHFGVRFVNIDRDAEQSVTRFVSTRLQDLYPANDAPR
jgi:c-di-GMP-binding flagellar brake protein YcgR